MSELTPYLCVSDAREAMKWYADVLGAEVTCEPIEMDDGRIGHVELAVDGAGWMMADEFPEVGVAAPDPERGASVTLHLTLADVDGLAERAVAAGARLEHGPANEQYAGRVAVFRDPYGHRWYLNRPVD